jgi:hypothetical protein
MVIPPQPYSRARSAWKAARCTLYAALTAVGIGALHLAMDASELGPILDALGVPRELASGIVLVVTFAARYLHDYLQHQPEAQG